MTIGLAVAVVVMELVEDPVVVAVVVAEEGPTAPNRMTTMPKAANRTSVRCEFFFKPHHLL
jgi:hypothetical protein